MPTSNIAQIPGVLACVQVIKPKSVLDLGFGFGKYGFLLREYIDVCGEIATSSGGDAPRSRIRIDGVEGFSSYIAPLQRLIYDDVIESDIRHTCSTLPDKKYDCCLLIDVLEHLDFSDGAQLLREMRRVADCAIVTTPKIFFEQGDLCGNPLERHLCVWSRRRLRQSGYDLFWPLKSQHIAISVKSAATRTKLKRLILRERMRSLMPIFMHDAYWRGRHISGTL